MSTQQPIQPTPGASAEACAAAREITGTFSPISIDSEMRECDVPWLAKIITRHFAPLLARVAELEKQVAAAKGAVRALEQCQWHVSAVRQSSASVHDSNKLIAGRIEDECIKPALAACAAAGLKEESK